MLQYLFAAFSLKPQYQALVGNGLPTSNNLLGIAIQEMQHLGIINHLLVKLGGAPCLSRQDFPYEPDIYPCVFCLEPATQKSIAKYVYAEAPSELFSSNDKSDITLCHSVKQRLNKNFQGNHVGSVYHILLQLIDTLVSNNPSILPDADNWVEQLTNVMREGEIEHFRFFKDMFLGTHSGFGDKKKCMELQCHT